MAAELTDAEVFGAEPQAPMAPITPEPPPQTLPQQGELSDAEVFGETDNTRMRVSTGEAVKKNPERSARVIDLQTRTGLPADVIDRNFEQVDQYDKAQALRKAGEASPALGAQLRDPHFANMAHDDVGPLTQLEKLIKQLGVSRDKPFEPPRWLQAVNPAAFFASELTASPDVPEDQKVTWSETGKAIVPQIVGGAKQTAGGFMQQQAEDYLDSVASEKGRQTLQGNVADLLRLVGLGELVDRSVAGGKREAAAGAQLAREGIDQANNALPEGKTASVAQQSVLAATNSLAQMVPGTVASLATRSPAPMLGIMGLQTEAQTYATARNPSQGTVELSPARARLAGALDGLIETGTEMIPAIKLWEKGGNLPKRLVSVLAAEVPSELLATTLQDANAKLSYNPEMTWAQFVQDMKVTLLSTSISAPVQAGTAHGLHTVARKLSGAVGKMKGSQQAEDAATGIQEVNKLATESKLRERNPAAFQQFIDEATKEGPVQDLYVDAETLFQAAEKGGVELPPTAKAQMQEALVSKSDVRIPLGEYAATLAGTPVGEALVPHLRTSPEAMSQAEAQEFMQSHVEEFKAEAAQAVENKQFDTAFQESAKSVENELLTQLNQANRFTPDVNSAYAAAMGAFYTTQASRLGVTPEELYIKYPLNIQAVSPVSGVALDQGALKPPELPPEQRAVYDAIPKARNLAPEQTAIESRFAAKLASQGLDATIAEYSAIPETQGGKVLNTDIARELSPDYLTDRTQSAAVHEPASWFIKEMYARKLAEAPKAGEIPLVMFTAGGTGAGKTTAINNVPEVANMARQAQIIYDTNLNGYESSLKKIQQARAAGKDVGIALVYRDPVDALVNGALPRAERQRAKFGTGRTVPLTEHLKTHIGALETARRLHAELGAGVTIRVINNTQGRDSAALVGLDTLPTLDYNKSTADAQTALEKAYAEGKISQDTYRGFAAVPTAQAHAGSSSGAGQVPQGDRAGARDQPQHERAQQSLDQVASGGNRGSVTFAPDITQSPTVISLLQKADLSTFLHESGHFYLEVLSDIASQPNAPAETQGDMQKLLDWFGVKDLATWRGLSLEEKRDSHEKFARGFESYLFEGKAPSTGLRALFGRFRAWMLNVYKSLKALNVELTDEVRGVMDRMLATDQQIQEAEAARSYAPLFASAKDAGMTADEWQSYQELGAEATQAAVANLQTRSLRNMQWLANARGRKLKELQKAAEQKRAAIHREVAAEVRSEPVYAVQNYMLKGDLPGFEKGQGVKISLGALQENYGEGTNTLASEFVAKFPKYVTATDGVHQDELASMFGFTSGDEMLTKILDAHPEASEIEGRTDQRMLERYGDMSSPEALERATNEAIHNEARAKFVATEIRALSKATGDYRLLTKAAKEFAETTISRKKVRDVKPAQYEAAEARAARNAQKAQAKADLVQAATEKRSQLVNNYTAKAAYDALDTVERGLRYLGKFDNEGTRTKLDSAYLDQIDAMLERFDLRKGQSLKAIDKRASLADWIKSQEDQLLEPTIPDELRNEAFRKHYKDLTVEEFRGMLDAVKNIEHLGRLKHKLLTAIDQREFDQAVDELVTSIKDNAKGTVPERRTSDRGLLVKPGKLFRRFTSEHRKFSSLTRELDGWQDDGKAWNYLSRNLNAAGDFEASQNERATVALTQLLKGIDTGKLGEKLYFKSTGKSFTREERISMLLNMGNEVNRERVQSGENLSPEQVQMIVGTLTKAEAEFANGVWAHLETYRPMIQEKEQRLTGATPEWVQAEPFTLTLADGSKVDMTGGYYPIKYDAERSTRSEADTAAEVQKQIERGLYTRAQTRRGHLKARTESTGRPLRYDLGVIAEHVTQVVHDLAWHEYLIDANRLLRNSQVDGAIREHYGPEKLRAMSSTLTDVAKGSTAATTAFGSVFSHLRFGATISGLGWRFSTSLLQPIGLTQSMSRIGTKWVFKGLQHWAGDAVHLQNSVRIVSEKSEFMRLRAKTLQREINEIRNKISGKESKLTASYFYLIQKMQLVADMPTWWGQYEKSMAQPNMTEERAIALADQAVIDAQGSGQLKDLSGIERGSEGQKLFTVFYSFFNTTYNLSAEVVGKTQGQGIRGAGHLAVDAALLYFIPATLGVLLKAALKGDWDEDKLQKDLVSENIGYFLGTMVGLRELGAGARALSGQYGGYNGPASVRLFSELSKLGTQAQQGEADAAFWKSLNNTAGILFHYPAGQINQTVAGIEAMASGDTENPGVLISGPSR